jgi:hypothetical protein
MRWTQAELKSRPPQTLISLPQIPLPRRGGGGDKSLLPGWFPRAAFAFNFKNSKKLGAQTKFFETYIICIGYLFMRCAHYNRQANLFTVNMAGRIAGMLNSLKTFIICFVFYFIRRAQ